VFDVRREGLTQLFPLIVPHVHVFFGATKHFPAFGPPSEIETKITGFLHIEVRFVATGFVILKMDNGGTLFQALDGSK